MPSVQRKITSMLGVLWGEEDGHVRAFPFGSISPHAEIDDSPRTVGSTSVRSKAVAPPQFSILGAQSKPTVNASTSSHSAPRVLVRNGRSSRSLLHLQSLRLYCHRLHHLNLRSPLRLDVVSSISERVLGPLRHPYATRPSSRSATECSRRASSHCFFLTLVSQLYPDLRPGRSILCHRWHLLSRRARPLAHGARHT